MTKAQRVRKITKLHRIRIQLSEESRSDGFTASERMMLARTTDSLREAIAVLESST